jgi:hypothetical protein
MNMSPRHAYNYEKIVFIYYLQFSNRVFFACEFITVISKNLCTVASTDGIAVLWARLDERDER